MANHTDKLGTVYLLHFDSPLAHAKHYIGFTTDLVMRLVKHQSGSGSALMAAVEANGITWKVAQTWENVDRNFERSLKNKKNTARFCPCCKGE
jgi:predicted GIY-YIG superfamily endonuclease